jgi:hypothetical protein
MTRALVIALACERPADRGVPLSRYSLSELAAEAANVLDSVMPPSRSSIWRWLMQDALRPWRHHCWIFPRDPHFLESAAAVLDLYACRWHGRPLSADKYVLSADEKTSIQARRRLQPTCLHTGTLLHTGSQWLADMESWQPSGTSHTRRLFQIRPIWHGAASARCRSVVKRRSPSTGVNSGISTHFRRLRARLLRGKAPVSLFAANMLGNGSASVL